MKIFEVFSARSGWPVQGWPALGVAQRAQCGDVKLLEEHRYQEEKLSRREKYPAERESASRGMAMVASPHRGDKSTEALIPVRVLLRFVGPSLPGGGRGVVKWRIEEQHHESGFHLETYVRS